MKLLERAPLERAIGRLTFSTRFLMHARGRINSAYASLVCSLNLKYRENISMVSARVAKDVASIADNVWHKRWVPLFSSPELSFQGM